MLLSCSVREMETPGEAPEVPSGLRSESLSDESLRFSWEPVSGADSYSWVLRSGGDDLVDLGKTSETSVEIEGLNTGDRYTFAVRASRGLAVSSYSGYKDGIPGGEYLYDKLKSLFLTAPSGTVWKAGDAVDATVDDKTVKLTCKDGGSGKGRFILDDGQDIISLERETSVRIVFPSGFSTLPSALDKDAVMPLAAVVTGISARMAPLCGIVTLNVVSDVARTASSLTLSSDSPMAGNASVDWSTVPPSVKLDGGNSVTFDFSAEPAALGADAVPVRLLLPSGVYGNAKLSAVCTDETVETPVFGGLTVSGNVDALCILPDLEDFYSIYRSGNSFSIGDRKIDIERYPECSFEESDAINTALGTPGLHFVDNGAGAQPWVYGAGRTKEIPDGVVMVGRYRKGAQPVLRIKASDTQGCLVFNGDVMFCNYSIECFDSSYGAIQGPKGLGNRGKGTSLAFRDCTIRNPKGYLISFNQGTYAVPDTMIFDNCIIRVENILINGGSKAENCPDVLRYLRFDDCVIASASGNRVEKDGCLVSLGSTTSPTDNFNMKMSHCTVYDFGTAQKTRGMINVKTCGMLELDHNVYYHSSFASYTGNFYTAYASSACTSLPGGINGEALYANNPSSGAKQGTANKSNISANGRAWKCSVTDRAETVDLSAVDSANDYFPSAVDGAGASYETKYWIEK